MVPRVARFASSCTGGGKVDKDTVLMGSLDGLVRAVQILPNMLLGVLGSHDGFPVEDMKWSNGRKMVGSISHDEYIRSWDASLLNDDDEDDDDDGGNDSDMREEFNIGSPAPNRRSTRSHPAKDASKYTDAVLMPCTRCPLG